MKKKPLVPREVYLNDVNTEYIHLVEKWFYEKKEFFPEQVRNDLDFSKYGVRMGYAYMNNLKTNFLDNSINDIVTLGDEKFAWKFKKDLFENNISELVFVCAGVGTNCSFEVELANMYPNALILLLDPSPQAIKYISSVPLPQNIIFIPKGLSDKSGTLTFLKPNVPGIGSLSSKNLVRGTEYITLEVISIEDLIKQYNLTNIDLLKFDIEGSEHDVVNSLNNLSFLPRQIAFEFDNPVPIWTVQETLCKVFSLDYRLADIWSTNVLLYIE